MTEDPTVNPVLYSKQGPKWDVDRQSRYRHWRQRRESPSTEIRREIPTLGANQLHPLVMDLGDLKQVQSAAHHFITRESRLDILVNNAAVLASPFRKDMYGISHSFTTNHLGPFVFTKALLSLLKKTALVNLDVRVVTVASTAHYLSPNDVKLGSVEDFNQLLGSATDMQSNFARYGLSKLANILFTKELQKILDVEGNKVTALAPHPGNVHTNGAEQFAEENPAFCEQLKDCSTPLEGALAVLFAAAHPAAWAECDKYAGAYLVPFGIIGETSETAQNAELAHQLWMASEQVVKNALA